MIIRQLTMEEIDTIYHQHLVIDFPSSEVKPLSNIRAGYEEGKYFAYAMFDDAHQSENQNSPALSLHKQEELKNVPLNDLRAYAFFIKSTVSETLLLDYLAVVRGQRSAGSGSIFLQELQKMCVTEKKNLVLEVENPDYADSEEIKAYREKRIRFYLRNNMVVSDVSCNFYDNEYRILYGKDSEYKCPLQTEIQHIYEDFFGKDFVQQHVTFH